MHKITFDPAKRAKTLKERELDFEDTALVFEGVVFTQLDDRREYGELRYQTYGFLRRRMVMVVWTPRYEARHIISMRKRNEREKKEYKVRLGGP
jgi:hypothetical protein